MNPTRAIVATAMMAALGALETRTPRPTRRDPDPGIRKRRARRKQERQNKKRGR